MRGAIASHSSGSSPKSSSMGALHRPVSRSISRVREAFVTSVTWTPPWTPPVRFHTSHESTVPTRSRPAADSARASGTSSRIQRILDAEK